MRSEKTVRDEIDRKQLQIFVFCKFADTAKTELDEPAANRLKAVFSMEADTIRHEIDALKWACAGRTSTPNEEK